MATQTNMEAGFIEKLGDKFTAFTEGCVGLLGRLFGSANDRQVLSIGYKRPKTAESHAVVAGSILAQVNALEEPLKALSDDDLKGLSDKFRARLTAGETLDDLMPEAFAACREAGPPGQGDAALRRADRRRRRSCTGGQHRRDGHRRGQDARRHPAGVPERAGGQGRPRHHRERLPRPPRLRVDAAHLQRPGRVAPRSSRATMDAGGQAARLRVRHHLRHQLASSGSTTSATT